MKNAIKPSIVSINLKIPKRLNLSSTVAFYTTPLLKKQSPLVKAATPAVVRSL
jgi:hypothetical protein